MLDLFGGLRVRKRGQLVGIDGVDPGRDRAALCGEQRTRRVVLGSRRIRRAIVSPSTRSMTNPAPRPSVAPSRARTRGPARRPRRRRPAGRTRWRGSRRWRAWPGRGGARARAGCRDGRWRRTPTSRVTHRPSSGAVPLPRRGLRRTARSRARGRRSRVRRPRRRRYSPTSGPRVRGLSEERHPPTPRRALRRRRSAECRTGTPSTCDRSSGRA